MARQSVHLLLLPAALSLCSGCVTPQKTVHPGPSIRSEHRNVDAPTGPTSEGPSEETATPTSDAGSLAARAETKIGVIDLVEVLRRAKAGQPALARLQREIQEVSRQEQQYLAQFHRSREYASFAKNPRYQSFKNAVHSIMPKVQAVAEVLAERGGFGIVMVKGNPQTGMTTFYSADAVDLTDQAIEELNRRFP